MKKNNFLYLLIAVSLLGNIILLALVVQMFFGFSMMGGSMMGNRFYKEMSEHMREENGKVENMATDRASPFAETHKSSYDFGRINKEDGVVQTTFEIENEGGGILKIGDISTSCDCTSAEIDTKTIPGGKKATLTVKFDPNFHEEPKGRFERSIFVKTNDPKNPEMRFKIFVDIIGN